MFYLTIKNYYLKFIMIILVKEKEKVNNIIILLNKLNFSTNVCQ